MGDETFVLEEASPSRATRPAPKAVRHQQTTDRVSQLQDEMDDYYRELTQLVSMDPMEVFQKLSSFSARASEIRSELFKVESRRAQSFRTQQVDPFLTEVDRQFKIHSRLQAIREMEARLVGPL